MRRSKANNKGIGIENINYVKNEFMLFYTKLIYVMFAWVLLIIVLGLLFTPMGRIEQIVFISLSAIMYCSGFFVLYNKVIISKPIEIGFTGNVLYLRSRKEEVSVLWSEIQRIVPNKRKVWTLFLNNGNVVSLGFISSNIINNIRNQFKLHQQAQNK